MFSVLHVDHSNFYNELIRNMISDTDIEYLSAQTPRDAIIILGYHKIDLIITALEFEHEKGEDFIKSLNSSLYKDIPVIVLSSTDDLEIKKRLFNMGVIDFINKNSFIDRFKNYINKHNSTDFTYDKLKEIKIAVLDDNYLELNRMKRILELNQVFNVDYYIDPEELLNSKEEYSLYLIDNILPKISGEQVVIELRSRLTYVVIIIISEIGNENAISTILNSGADDYITKPHSEGILMARLRANIRTFLLLQELKEKNMELERIVVIDGLTNLFNHKYAVKKLEEEVSRCKRHKRKLSVAMLDIDKFKLINDIYGHQYGDEVLIKVSNIFKNHIRVSDMIGRYGGEEFILILPETDLQGAVQITEKLRVAIAEAAFGKENLKVTISCGIAEMENENTAELIKKSDICMYKAKENGRNRIEF